MRTVHPRIGFQKSFFRETFEQKEMLGLGLADVEFFRQSVPKIKREKRPFMAYLITLSTHHSWHLPKELRVPNVPAADGSLAERYVQAMHHFDEGFGEFLDSLQKSGLLDESVLVVYGDHKAQFGKGEERGRLDLANLMNGYAGWARPDSGHDYRYWSLQNQLPLIIHLPGDAAAGERANTVGHLDIAPTLLNLLGIENHDMVTLGRDVSGGEDEFVVFRNGSFVYADTLCVTPNASPATAKCNDTRTGAVLDANKFRERFADARKRLAVSDMIITANLIPTH
jgi:phosphoglycerol transferase MdoB-like AlkP superfamily enzyme